MPSSRTLIHLVQWMFDMNNVPTTIEIVLTSANMLKR